MKSYYLIDSKDLMEMADSIRNAEQNISFDFILTNEDIAYPSDSNNHWKIISTYYSSTLTMENYEFEVSGIFNFNISNFAYNIVINSISPTLDQDLIVKISDNSTVIVSTIPTATHLDGTDIPGIISISGTIYQVKNNEGTNMVTIPAGTTSAGEAPSDKLEWPDGFISAISNLPSVSTYGLNELFGMSEFTCLANEVKSYCFYSNEIITSVNLPNCGQVNDHAFTACSNLSSISLPNCNEIKGYAFDGCLSLNYISLPNCKILGDDVFRNCALSSIDLPKCESIGVNNFYSTNIANVSLPLIKSLPYSAFFHCSSLININMPECEYIGTMCFKGCTTLSEINFSQIKIISTQAFEDCTNLTTVTLPNCIELGYAAFASCNNLSYIELPKCEKIYSSAFNGCQNLLSLYLMNSQVVTLSGSYQFNSTPIIGSTASTSQQGYIYVPSSLYNNYIIASEWSYYSSYIVGV